MIYYKKLDNSLNFIIRPYTKNNYLSFEKLYKKVILTADSEWIKIVKKK